MIAAPQNHSFIVHKTKISMKHISMLMFGLLLISIACTDPEKDPFQLEKITKGSILTLRGTAYSNLVTYPLVFRGAVDTFNVNGNAANEKFEFEADFQSDDVNSLDQVEIYARATETGPRVRVAVIDGSSFTIPSGGTYPRGSISIPLNDILSVTSTTLADYAPGSYIYIECDLTLTDGRLVPASSIVNSSLFESSIFYPAHNLLYLARG